jgi:hypothetical protein
MDILLMAKAGKEDFLFVSWQRRRIKNVLQRLCAVLLENVPQGLYCFLFDDGT